MTETEISFLIMAVKTLWGLLGIATAIILKQVYSGMKELSAEMKEYRKKQEEQESRIVKLEVEHELYAGKCKVGL